MDARLIELMQTVKIPLELNCKAGDRLVIVTDYEFDPVVWQAVSAAATQMGMEVTVAMMPVREAHQAEPTWAVAEAMKAADVNIYLTSKAMVHTKAAKEACQEKKVRTILMEQADYSILTGPVAKADYCKIQEVGKRVRDAFLKAKEMTILTDMGTNITASVEGRTALCVAGKTYPEEGQYICAFPDGEVPTMPVEGTGNGTVVWDTSAHHIHGRLLKEPIKIKVKNGWAVEITGGEDARALQEYIEKYGDKNTYNCPAEFAVGLNPAARPRGIVREDKKLLGYVHIALGSTDGIDGKLHSKLHLDGLMKDATVKCDGKIVVDKGKIVV
jgi:leucyl aminopeptidase (aminopeptidase T)